MLPKLVGLRTLSHSDTQRGCEHLPSSQGLKEKKVAGAKTGASVHNGVFSSEDDTQFCISLDLVCVSERVAWGEWGTDKNKLP